MIASLALLVQKFRGIKSRAEFTQLIVLFVILSSVGLSISACSHQILTDSESIQQTNMPTTTPKSAKFGATEEITSTATNQATAVITDTVIVDNSIVGEKCIEGIAELGEEKNLSGTIVLYINDADILFYNLLLFAPEIQEITEITPPYAEENTILLSDISVFPDGGYLAYQTRYYVGDEYNGEYIGNKIKIINAENAKISEINNLYPDMYFEWLNNYVLMIPTIQEKNPLLLTEIPSGNQKYLYPILDEGFFDSDYFRWWFFMVAIKIYIIPICLV